MDHEGWPAVLQNPRFVTSSPCSGMSFGPEIVHAASMLVRLHFRISIEDQIPLVCGGAPFGMEDEGARNFQNIPEIGRRALWPLTYPLSSLLLWACSC